MSYHIMHVEWVGTNKLIKVMDFKEGQTINFYPSEIETEVKAKEPGLYKYLKENEDELRKHLDNPV